jgi:hypothetical protein
VPDDAAHDDPDGRRTNPPQAYNPSFHMNGWLRAELAHADGHACIAICSLVPMDQQGPADLECFVMEAPHGSRPVEVRMRDLKAAMMLPEDVEPRMVRFTVVKSPIRRVDYHHLGGETDYPCWVARAPKGGELVWVDTVDMYAVHMMENDAPVELWPPSNARFIGAPPMTPAPGHYRHLGMVTTDGDWYHLFCPGLHIKPVEMDWSESEESGGPQGTGGEAGSTTA